MDSIGTNRTPLRSVAASATRSSALPRPHRHPALGNRLAATKLGIAARCGGARGYFGKVQRFDAARSTSARAQSGKAGRSVIREMGHTSSDSEMPLNYSSGKAFPLGVSQADGGLNFAIFSQNASSVTLCLKLPERGTQDDAEIVEFALDRQKNKAGDIWHVSVEEQLMANQETVEA
ncbi:isoamylase 3, chloroplastic-like isoform X3 [Panicum hallii]|uniref:isoamylase 3, chloroplastic-like isoform X3 n=1 Tax=Panicum hallii TaxID=206008 RepID=UPI000DF4EB3B|nr:isoamylase 3, chloroplastic-like isoform X3 [Panicum hallii]